MLIISERVDKEYFVDIVLSKKELEEILEGDMGSGEFQIGSNIINIGVRIALKGEEDAIKKREIKKSNRGKH